ISGSKVRVLDGPPIESGTSGASGCPVWLFGATLVPKLVPDRNGNGLCDRANSSRYAIKQVHPPAPLVRDPARVVAERRRRVDVSELRTDVGDRRAGGEK